MKLAKFKDTLASIPKTGPKGCQKWPLGRFADGYGGVLIEGVPGTQKAHRAALELKLGRPIQSGKWALHTCDNKSCVNSEHLYEGTPRDNSKDAVERGQYPSGLRNGRYTKPEQSARGERHGAMTKREKFSKLSDEDILQIPVLYATRQYRQIDLARKFGVSRGSIGRVLSGESWKNIERTMADNLPMRVNIK